MADCVNWFFGRGASIACGLPWSVPKEIQDLPRERCIAEITSVLQAEMDNAEVDTTPYRQLLAELANHTREGWSHRFLTTNWDYLLQREIFEMRLKMCPRWMESSHVYHLNGTVEQLDDNSRRSKFILETDKGDARVPSHELDVALRAMVWNFHFVVVGMSFECEGDKFLLGWLNGVEDYVPVGESVWLMLNPDRQALQASLDRIQSALPRATVRGAVMTLETWLAEGLEPLRELGVLST